MLGSLTNELLSKSITKVSPEVWLGCTVIMYTDRRAGTIIKVNSEKSITIQYDKATRTDSNGMSDCQIYSYSLNPEGRIETYTLRKNGRWILEGDSLTGQPLKLGIRMEYYDFCF